MTSSPPLPLEDGHLRFLRALAAASLPPEGGGHSIGEVRDAAAAARSPWRSGGPDMHAVREHSLPAETGSVRLRIYYPITDRPLPAIVYLHGRGWALLDLDTHDRIMREYASASGWTVVGVDYPRSPETQFPGAIESCVSA